MLPQNAEHVHLYLSWKCCWKGDDNLCFDIEPLHVPWTDDILNPVDRRKMFSHKSCMTTKWRLVVQHIAPHCASHTCSHTHCLFPPTPAMTLICHDMSHIQTPCSMHTHTFTHMYLNVIWILLRRCRLTTLSFACHHYLEKEHKWDELWHKQGSRFFVHTRSTPFEFLCNHVPHSNRIHRETNFEP